ncbi:MAG: hypothetical protein Q4D91_09130 [Lautropia sp.]|nr:hypothetical protein [Lautropia sp.]
MSTQKHHALNLQNAPVVAGRPVEGKAAKLSAKKADLDKLAKADIEQDIVLAEAQTDAPVDVAMAENMDTAAANGIGAMEGGAAAEGAATVSPLAIGAGAVAGVVAIAALAGGGASSSSSNNDNLQQKPPVDENKQNLGKDDEKAEGEKVEPPKDDKGQGGNAVTGPAEAGGPIDKPLVATTGETKLKAGSFELTKADGSPVEYVKIVSIEAREDNDAGRTRLVRYGLDTGEPKTVNEASGINLTVKDAVDADLVVDQNKVKTAYEVITPDQPVSFEQAKAMAEKLGGKLLMVDDEGEAKWLQNAFKQQLGEHTAWIAGNAQKADGANVAKLTGEVNAQALSYDNAAADAKQPAFIIEYSNYKHPLLLNGVPVEEGQIIARDDLGKLSWNADMNSNGLISIVAVTTNDPATAEVIKGTDDNPIGRDIALTESETIKPPVSSQQPSQGDGTSGSDDQGSGGGAGGSGDGNPASPQLHEHDELTVKHDTLTDINKGVLGHGLPNDAKAQFIKILDVHSAETEGGKRVVNWHENVEGKKPSAYELVKTGKPITLEEAKAMAEKLGGKLLVINDDAEADWLAPQLGVDASTYHFEDARQKAQGKAVVATKADSEPMAVSEDEVKDTKADADSGSDDSSTATGTQPAQSSGMDSAEQSEAEPAKENQATGQKTDSPSQGDTPAQTTQETQGTLAADPSANADATAAGQDQGAKDEAGKVQTDEGEQKPAVPAAEDQQTQDASANVPSANGQEDAGQQPTAEPKKLSAFVIEYEEYDSPLRLNEQRIHPGATISADDFHNLAWDSTENSGGGFKYVAASDEQGTEVPGAVRQYVPVKEAAAETPAPAENVPTYDAAGTHTADVAHNAADHNFESMQSRFEGTDAANKATHVKISEVKKNGTDAADAGTLKYNGKDVVADTVVDLSQLNKLVWDASMAEGGSFKFTAVKENGDAFTNPPAAQTVTINEAPYVPEAEVKEVAKNADTPLGKEVFDFSVEGKAEPGFVKIVGITATADEMAADRIVRTEGDGDSAVKTAYQVVKVADGITLEAAKAEAIKMGGTLLEITNQAELDWIKGSAELMGKLNLGDAGEDITKGAWFLNPSADGAADAADKEGIFSTGTEASTFSFADAEAATGKMSAYVVEFANYNGQKPGLMLEGQSGQKSAVAVSDVIEGGEIEKLSWDSMFNNGGEVKFIEVTSKVGDTNAEGAVEKTITITEAAAVASAPAVVSNLVDEQNPAGTGMGG